LLSIGRDWSKKCDKKTSPAKGQAVRCDARDEPSGLPHLEIAVAAQLRGLLDGRLISLARESASRPTMPSPSIL